MKKTSANNPKNSETTPVDVFLGRAAMVGFILAFGAYLTVDALAPSLI